HVRVPHAVRDCAREADEARAVPGGNDVSGPGDLLRKPRAVFGHVEPRAAEELRELLEVDVLRLAVADHWQPCTGQVAGGIRLFKVCLQPAMSLKVLPLAALVRFGVKSAAHQMASIA